MSLGCINRLPTLTPTSKSPEHRVSYRVAQTPHEKPRAMVTDTARVLVPVACIAITACCDLTSQLEVDQSISGVFGQGCVREDPIVPGTSPGTYYPFPVYYIYMVRS